MKIPNFKLALTEQERLLISTPGNIICLGRSGTGKTTSAVLRLFAIEMLFKIKQTMLHQTNKGEKANVKEFKADDAE